MKRHSYILFLALFVCATSILYAGNNQIIVKIQQSATNSIGKMESILQEAYIPTKTIEPMFEGRAGLEGIYIISLDQKYINSRSDVQAYANSLRARHDVEYSHINHVNQLQRIPGDPQYNGQWQLPNISAPQAWELTIGNRNVKLAVIDSGIDYLHQDLKDNIWVNQGEIPESIMEEADYDNDGYVSLTELESWIVDNNIDYNSDSQVNLKDILYGGVSDYQDNDGNGYVDDIIGWDFTEGDYIDFGDNSYPDNNPQDEVPENNQFYGHGTKAAGCALATGDNGLNICGVSWVGSLMCLRAGHMGWLEDDDGAYGILYAIDNGANVINLSWGNSHPSDLLKDIINYGYNQGVIFTAAAGNESSEVIYPAGFSNVLAVGASTDSNSRASFSNYGSKLDFLAPGSSVLTLEIGGGSTLESGTSFAAPIAAGAVMLLKAYYPGYSADQIMDVMRYSCDDIYAPGFDNDSGYGKLNIANALNYNNSRNLSIDSPVNESYFAQDFEITGSIKGAGLTEYKVSYGYGFEPESYYEIHSGYSEIIDGIIADFNVSAFQDTMLTLKIEADFGDEVLTKSLFIGIDKSNPVFELYPKLITRIYDNHIEKGLWCLTDDDTRLQVEYASSETISGNGFSGEHYIGGEDIIESNYADIQIVNKAGLNDAYRLYNIEPFNDFFESVQFDEVYKFDSGSLVGNPVDIDNNGSMECCMFLNQTVYFYEAQDRRLVQVDNFDIPNDYEITDIVQVGQNTYLICCNFTLNRSKVYGIQSGDVFELERGPFTAHVNNDELYLSIRRTSNSSFLLYKLGGSGFSLIDEIEPISSGNFNNLLSICLYDDYIIIGDSDGRALLYEYSGQSYIYKDEIELFIANCSLLRNITIDNQDYVLAVTNTSGYATDRRCFLNLLKINGNSLELENYADYIVSEYDLKISDFGGNTGMLALINQSDCKIIDLSDMISQNTISCIWQGSIESDRLTSIGNSFVVENDGIALMQQNQSSGVYPVNNFSALPYSETEVALSWSNPNTQGVQWVYYRLAGSSDWQSVTEPLPATAGDYLLTLGEFGVYELKIMPIVDGIEGPESNILQVELKNKPELDRIFQCDKDKLRLEFSQPLADDTSPNLFFLDTERPHKLLFLNSKVIVLVFNQNFTNGMFDFSIVDVRGDTGVPMETSRVVNLSDEVELPVINNVNLVNSGTLKDTLYISFSKSMESESILELDNYSISSLNVLESVEMTGSQTARLVFTGKFPASSLPYSVSCSRLFDEEGFMISSNSGNIAYFSVMFDDFSGFNVYPNPVKLGEQSSVKFSNFPLNVNIKLYIYNIAGELVFSKSEQSIGFTSWNLQNSSGNSAGRGIYLYYFESGSFEKKGKIVLK